MEVEDPDPRLKCLSQSWPLLCGVHARLKQNCDVYIEYFSLQISEIKYILHLHYQKKSIYRNQIKLAIQEPLARNEIF